MQLSFTAVFCSRSLESSLIQTLYVNCDSTVMPVRSSQPILQVKKAWMKKICTMTRAPQRKAGADEYICKSIEVRKYLTSDGVAAEHGKKIALYCEKEIWAMATLGLCFRYLNEAHFVSHMQFHCIDSGSEEFQETVSRLRRGEKVYGWSIQCLQLPKVDSSLALIIIGVPTSTLDASGFGEAPLSGRGRFWLVSLSRPFFSSRLLPRSRWFASC